MLEILLLGAALILTPPNAFMPVLFALAILITIPGAYATWYGAPYVPSKHPIVARMIKLARLKPGETAYDLGCGDGRILRAAAATGATAIGYELSLLVFPVCWLRCLFHPRIRVRYGNFWTKDYRDADAIFCFLLTDSMQTFKQRIWPQLKPGCRVVSHSFRMKDVAPDEEAEKVVMYIKKAA